MQYFQRIGSLADFFIQSQRPSVCCPLPMRFFLGLSFALRLHDQILASNWLTPAPPQKKIIIIQARFCSKKKGTAPYSGKLLAPAVGFIGWVFYSVKKAFVYFLKKPAFAVNINSGDLNKEIHIFNFVLKSFLNPFFVLPANIRYFKNRKSPKQS